MGNPAVRPLLLAQHRCGAHRCLQLRCSVHILLEANSVIMKQSCTFVLAGVVLAACLLHCSARQEEAPASAPAALANYAFPGHNLRSLKGSPPCVNYLPALHMFPHALV